MNFIKNLFSSKNDCPHGSKCFRKNPEHLNRYRHLHLDELLPLYLKDPSFSIPEQFQIKHAINDVNLVLLQLSILKNTMNSEVPKRTSASGDIVYRSRYTEIETGTDALSRSTIENNSKTSKTEVLLGSPEFEEIQLKFSNYQRLNSGKKLNIVKIIKLSNVNKLELFRNLKQHTFDDFEDQLFYQLPNDELISLQDELGNCGRGVYFSTSPSSIKSPLLLCRVILGRSKTAMIPDKNITKSSLHNERYDSVYCPNQAGPGGIYVIYDEAQVYLEYFINLTNTTDTTINDWLRSSTIGVISGSNPLNLQCTVQGSSSTNQMNFPPSTVRGTTITNQMNFPPSTVRGTIITNQVYLPSPTVRATTGSNQLNLPSSTVRATTGSNQLNLQSSTVRATTGSNQLNLQSSTVRATNGSSQLNLPSSTVQATTGSNQLNLPSSTVRATTGSCQVNLPSSTVRATTGLTQSTTAVSVSHGSLAFSRFSEQDLSLKCRLRQQLSSISSSADQFEGIILRLIPPKKFGFIKADLPPPFDQKDVHFRYNQVYNLEQNDNKLEEGQTVHFTLNRKNEAKPSVLSVGIGGLTEASEGSSSDARNSGAWRRGIIVNLQEKSIFVKPIVSLPKGYAEKDIFVPPSNFSINFLPLSRGDEVEFQLGDRDKTRPMAKTARLWRYSARNLGVLLDYFKCILNQLDDESQRTKILREILPSRALWLYLSSLYFESTVVHLQYLIHLLHFLNAIVQHSSKSCLQYTTVMLDVIWQSEELGSKGKITTCFDSILVNWGKSDIMTYSNVSVESIFLEFITRSMANMPQLLQRIYPFVVKVGSHFVTKNIQEWILQLFKLMADNDTNAFGNHDNWQNVSLIPSSREINGTLFENDSLLSEVPLGRPFTSVEEYLEIYFRLMRSECFSSIQSGIQELMENCLDDRDMGVFHSVYLVGFDTNESGFLLGLKFKPNRPVRDWKMARELMYGNLICLSPSGRFNDSIWATVANRDLQLLNTHSTIVVNICSDFNQMSTSQVISTLWAHNGSTIMVESPSYYHSYRPVLATLQSSTPEDIVLQNEIVYGHPQPNTRPSYLSKTTLLDLSSIGINDCLSIEELIQSFPKRQTNLDDSQKSALLHALTNRLAIIQGPPGCGKTFVGVKIAEIILHMKPNPLNSPILVLTYKNHALDEFLKHLLHFLEPSDIARIGSRSKESKLESCNLNELLRSSQVDKSIRSEINNLREEIFAMKDCIQSIMQELKQSAYLSENNLLNLLSENQVESLLREASYGTKNGEVKFFIDKNRIASKKDIVMLINNVKSKFESVKNCILQPTNCDLERICKALFKKVLDIWLPPKDEIRKLKAMQTKFIAEIEKSKKLHESALAVESSEDVNDYDEEAIEAIQEARLSMMNNVASGGQDRQISNSWTWIGLDDNLQLHDLPSNLEYNPSLATTESLWILNEVQKTQLLYSITKPKLDEVSDRLEESLEQLSKLCKQKTELEIQKKVDILMSKKVVGMTITGACINHELIEQVGPAVVIVEEAAEVLEPNLFAALTSKLQHLILIGDHEQLRPQVCTYRLRTEFHLDFSLMERLIKLDFPYMSLTKQNRMRPEFAKLLHDIYPTLQDNLERVQGNEALDFVEKSMFFWSHTYPEKSDRSHTNKDEADMAIALASFLIFMGIPSEEITILAAYQGQVTIIRKEIKQLNFRVTVNTIDMYQGDENKYVIVSLVRSNKAGQIGFLKERNRRCVAQSRAKCGLYFVGNVDTLMKAKDSCWKNMLSAMNEQNCVGTELCIQCPKHKQTKHFIEKPSELCHLMKNVGLLCKKPCGITMPCNISSHNCTKPCQPPHSHSLCQFKVDFVHPVCNHADKKQCHQNIRDLSCKTKVSVKLARCGHVVDKLCFQSDNEVVCTNPCVQRFPCQLHPCPKKCNPVHDHKFCNEMVDFVFPICKHSSRKKCSEAIEGKTCEQSVNFTFAKCNHRSTTKCYIYRAYLDNRVLPNVELLKCQEIIPHVFQKCGHKSQVKCCIPKSEHTCKDKCQLPMETCSHPCSESCGTPHTHTQCLVKVDYVFPKCGHPSPKKKGCTQQITWACKYDVIEPGSCGHPIKRRCNETGKCEAPCTKLRKCSHPCTNKCGEDCELGACKSCNTEYENKLQFFRNEAKKQMRMLQQKIRDTGTHYKGPVQLLNRGDTKAEYQSVEDMVLKYIKPEHNWYPTITKIEKVINLKLQWDYFQAKSEAFGDYEDQKFHGTSSDGVKGITENGFRIPTVAGMYGAGIYFATDSSKSSQTIYTKGSNSLLLCRVLLGKTKEQQNANPKLDRNTLRKEKFDSVYAPRGSKGAGGVLFDEFVVFDTRQAYPEYIIYYNTNGLSTPAQLPLFSGPLQIVNKKPSRTVDLNDPYDAHYRLAEGHFHRMMALHKQQHQIESIDIVINKNLLKKFEDKQHQFSNNNIPNKIILAYHGTNVVNIKSILQNNLSVAHAQRQAYGRGNYFSEFPDVSIGYGSGLILCKLLPGKEWIDKSSNNIPLGYYSKLVDADPNAGNSSQMVIIEDSDQILPCFVIHLK